MWTPFRFPKPLLWTLVAVGLALAAAAPGAAAETATEKAAPPETATLASPCGSALPLFGELDAWLAAPVLLEGGEATPVPASAITGVRTCRCSCGQPCKTDADCGPGGVCRAGITCCAVPSAELAPDSPT